MSILKVHIPSEDELCNEVKACFSYYPCQFQVKDVLAQLQGQGMITIAAMGLGKTLTFWSTFFFDGINLLSSDCKYYVMHSKAQESTIFGLYWRNILSTGLILVSRSSHRS